MEDWYGHQGSTTIAYLRKNLSLPKRTDIKTTLIDVKCHQDKGLLYIGTQIITEDNIVGHPSFISIGSDECQIIANSIESRMSIQ